jgi:hypothetical protein
MGHLYSNPSSTCQSPPSIMYSPPLQQLTSRPPVSMASNGVMYPAPHEYKSVMESPYQHANMWTSQPPFTSTPAYTYPSYSTMPTAPAMGPEQGLLPTQYHIPHPRDRSHSASSSNGLPMPSNVMSTSSPPALSRSLSPSSPDLRAYGHPNKNGSWCCAYPGCTSRAVFTRGCDLRKHHKRHTKSFFCRHPDCPQSTGGGFSSKKDLARHEAKHSPNVLCDWDGCDRVFSRVDNMVSSDRQAEANNDTNRTLARPRQAYSPQGISQVIDNFVCLKRALSPFFFFTGSVE